MERTRLIADLRTFAGEALVERDGACFLVDPGWGARERAQWEALVARRPANWDRARGWLCIPTGGSSGAMKLARHDERTLAAAVAGFCAHFGASRVNAVGLLPPWHVSGLAAWARCRFSGGEYRTWDWKRVEQGERPSTVDAGDWFVSLVPTQIARLLRDPAAVSWLRGFRAVLVGGGPAWPEILVQARAARVPLALTYGMTETAAMVAAQTPEDFLAGDNSSGRAMPQARIKLDRDGRGEVDGDSLFLGYWPDTRESGPWRTDDFGELDASGRLRITGRADALIITGGEKVNPAEVEAALREAGAEALSDVVVVGAPHPEWGAEVVALFPGDASLAMRLREGVARSLAPAKRPKRYIDLRPEDWPRDGRGKLNRAALEELAVRMRGI